ncbi:hypothetical protein, partial [Parvibaculum sp.]|uniref:hypothetical protein n=1 Tax=Parvibaculum sp. TaxID=2024848 RepID=UPI003919F6EE
TGRPSALGAPRPAPLHHRAQQAQMINRLYFQLDETWGSGQSVDLIVYPAAFAYRHAIELYLKHLVLTLNLILETGQTFKKNHKMIDLWKEASKLNEATKLDLLEEKAIDRAGELIGYFDAFDPTGQVFRYPEDIMGNRHLAKHKLINVEVLRDQMRELQGILERWVYQAMEHRDWQLGQAAEYNTN